MNTPICDFVEGYCRSGTARLHMPGHKGIGPIGVEARDITEIAGADDLADAEGIILESERNAAALFGSGQTFYSTGGSSQCIKAMLHLAMLHRAPGSARTVLAGRNAHKAFLHACALLDILPHWLQPEPGSAFCACPISPQKLEAALREMEPLPAAVYVTSPDYLGGMLDVAALAVVCRSAGVPLLVDNAHGAYLRFLEPPMHPMMLGAAMCCDSAHKTLPVLTGGAYLHLAPDWAQIYGDDARAALSVFGSSSPSYLILQSLDACNAALDSVYPARLATCIRALDALRGSLAARGVPVMRTEPLKVTVDAAAGGTSGTALAARLREAGVEPEYADCDAVVLMASPENNVDALGRIEAAFAGFQLCAPRRPISIPAPGRRICSPREAMLARRERVPVLEAAGRVCADAAVSCPPAIPIAVMGEEITQEAVACMARFGIQEIAVMR